jgi:hypothetical protein
MFIENGGLKWGGVIILVMFSVEGFLALSPRLGFF